MTNSSVSWYKAGPRPGTKTPGFVNREGPPPGRHREVAPLGMQHLPKVEVRLPGKGVSNFPGARPVHLIITMIKWIQTSRLSLQNSLSLSLAGHSGLSDPSIRCTLDGIRRWVGDPSTSPCLVSLPRADLTYATQSRPECGPACQTKVLQTFQIIPFSLQGGCQTQPFIYCWNAPEGELRQHGLRPVGGGDQIHPENTCKSG